MKTIMKTELLILIPETAEETAELAAWKKGRYDHVLAFQANSGRGLALRLLSLRAAVCRQPIQVSSRSPDPQIRLIGNFAPTPFELDGVRYACVESFWQSLRFPECERPQIAALGGLAAKCAGLDRPYGTSVTYDGGEVLVGTWGHWQLMGRACWSKFTQHAEARAALLATEDRPLVHKMRRDSQSIPGAIMADIWMRIRTKLRDQAGTPAAEAASAETEGEEEGD